jgi:anti-sigma regulatory factor (Ser/Thr protein kinase)
MTASAAPPGSEVRSNDPEFELDVVASVSAEYPAHVGSPRAARHFVSDVMRKWGFSREVRDEAELVVTELAANAVLHAKSEFSILLRAASEVVRIAVHDTMPVDPALLVVRPGRGLGLVSGLARDWGVDVTAAGKTVWAEIDATYPG